MLRGADKVLLQEDIVDTFRPFVDKRMSARRNFAVTGGAGFITVELSFEGRNVTARGERPGSEDKAQITQLAKNWETVAELAYVCCLPPMR